MLTPILITVDSEFDSAKLLGFETMSWDFLDSDFDYFKNRLVFRWGNSSLFNKEYEFPHVVNPGMAIRQNCNKKAANAKLSKAVHTPKQFIKQIPKDTRAVYRPINHTGGSDFQIITGPHEIKDGHYATEFIDTDREIRCWFADGAVMGGMRVPLARLSQTWEEKCRSNWGYRYTGVSQALTNKVNIAAETIGLKFGAADILIKDGKYYFLELNSAPTIDTETLTRFFRTNILEHTRRYNQNLLDKKSMER